MRSELLPVAWLLDSMMLERSAPGSSLQASLEELGIPYLVSSWSLNDGLRIPVLPEWRTHQIVVWGSHQFGKAAQRLGVFENLQMYGATDRVDFLCYTTNMHDLPWLNHDCMALPWGAFRTRRDFLQQVYGGTRVFTRPNSGFKTYAGQTVSYAKWDEECTALDQVSSVMPETLVIAARDVEILGEFRFVVAEQRVVAGSEYRWDNVQDLRRDWPEDCYELATRVAGHSWQLDAAYVADVALTADGPRLIELNSFAHAGLYACDTLAVASAVTEVAEKRL